VVAPSDEIEHVHDKGIVDLQHHLPRKVMSPRAGSYGETETVT
jgi:hypothetical protein